MDGAIVIDPARERIVRAAVQLVPDARLPAQESGTRHRTAERVARQSGLPVITVSKSMRTIAVFTGGSRYMLEDSAALLARAHQALGMLERCGTSWTSRRNRRRVASRQGPDFR